MPSALPRSSTADPRSTAMTARDQRHRRSQAEAAAVDVVERRDAVGGDAEAHEVEAGFRHPDSGRARGEVEQGSVGSLGRDPEPDGDRDGGAELGESGGIVLGGGVGEVRPQSGDPHVPGLLGLERGRDERGPVLGARAVAVQPGVDLEMNGCGTLGCDAPAIASSSAIDETPSSMSASIAAPEVGVAHRAARRRAAPSTPASRSASAAGTSSTASESAPDSSAAFANGIIPCP